MGQLFYHRALPWLVVFPTGKSDDAPDNIGPSSSYSNKSSKVLFLLAKSMAVSGKAIATPVGRVEDKTQPQLRVFTE